MEAYNDDCPICYNAIFTIDVCITACHHKFHASCLKKCGKTCPMCRTPIIFNTSALGIPAGTYTSTEYLEQLRQRNISVDDISPTARIWLEECAEHDEMLKELEERKKQREEKRKNTLKKIDTNKYQLFYGKK